MFATAITMSARFLRMPQTARLLYYDLGMAADDDGVAEGFTVVQTTGADEDDLRFLESRGFIQVLNDDLVCQITHWTTNNQIRKDRYHRSVYTELLAQLDNGDQMTTACCQDGKQPTTNRQPDDNQRLTEVSLGEESLVKVSPVKEKGADKHPHAQSIPPTVEEVLAYCLERKNGIDAAHFVDYYTARGWMVGKTKMRDWKAAVRTWEKTQTSPTIGKGRVSEDCQTQAAQGRMKEDVEQLEAIAARIDQTERGDKAPGECEPPPN
jgi:hypothetical protein